MNKCIYIYKGNAHSWSSAIEEQAALFSRDGAYTVRLTYNIIRDCFSILKIKCNGSKILINHSINAWYFLILSCLLMRVGLIFEIKRNGYLLAHEGEPLFSRVRYSGVINFIKSSMRYHYIISLCFHEVIVLNAEQRIIYRRGIAVNYLGVDLPDSGLFSLDSCDDTSKLFGKIDFNGCCDSVRFFFPQDIRREEKGFCYLVDNVQALSFSCSLIYPINCPNEILLNKYLSIDIVAIPSIDYETYSITLIEALMNNKIILASSCLGLIKNILSIYSKLELESLGLFIIDDSLSSSLMKASEFFFSKNKPNTDVIYRRMDLSVNGAYQRLCHTVGLS